MAATLSALNIRNLALVEELEWNLASGFTAITGETGAGKSIILGALKLVLGERADRSLIRSGAQQCSVEAIFLVDESVTIDVALEEQGIEACEDGVLIVRRVFSASGTNRQFLNGSATTLGFLKQVGDGLVDLHGPHDHQSLFSAEQQLAVLDSYCGNRKLLAEYSVAYAEWTRKQRRYEDLSGSEAAMEQEIDLLRHQVEEISGAELTSEDDGGLEEVYSRASNSRQLVELSSQLVNGLSESDDSILSRLEMTQRLIRDLSKLDASMESAAQSHESVVIEVEELVSTLQRYSDSLDVDPQRLAELEERMNLVQTLKRKYGQSVEEIIAFGDRAAERLAEIEGRGDQLQKLDKEIAEAKDRVLKVGGKLSARRRKQAPKLAAEVRQHIADLGFTKAGFDVVLEADDEPTGNGLESVDFQFAPNPGEPSKPLKAIASSGEISRVMLAIKTALADKDAIGVLVFDEIDANVGGEIAHVVGTKMKSLSASHQVLCITHLAPVAAQADAHFVVNKELRNERTVTSLQELDEESRVMEIMRMLGGKTKSAQAHAKELLHG